MLNSVHEFMHILVGMVQSDCHSGRRKTNLFNTQPLLNTITNMLDKEIVGSSFTPASLDSSPYSEVVNIFYVEENQSRGNFY